MARKRIRVADFRGEPIELEFPDGSVYLVRGDFPVEIVAYMADLEERGDKGTEDDEVEEFEAWLEEGHALIQRLVREGDPTQKEAELPKLSPHELLGLMGALVGGESVGMALAEAMSEGIGEALERKREQEAAADPTKPKKGTGGARAKAAA